MKSLFRIRDLGQTTVRAADAGGVTLQLLRSDSRRQIFNISANKIVKLPTTSIKKGEVFYLSQVSDDNKLTIQASDASSLCIFDSKFARASFTALIDTPVTSTDWYMEFFFEQNVYSHGTSYNGGNAPTIALSAGGGTLSSIAFSQFIPYQLKDGTWRMRFNFEAVVSSTARTTASFTVNGISGDTPTQGAWGGTGNNQTIERSQFDNGAPGTFSIIHGSASATRYRFFGDVSLPTKPTWAY